MVVLVEPAVLEPAQMAAAATAVPEVAVVPHKTRVLHPLVPSAMVVTAVTRVAEALPASQEQVQERPALLAVVASMEWEPTVETVAQPSFRPGPARVGKAAMAALVAHLESRATVAPAVT